MQRSYKLELHRRDRIPRLYDAQLYRVTGDGGLQLVAEVEPNHDALGIERVFEVLAAQLIDHQDDHGELP